MKHAQKGVVYLWALFAVTVAGVVLAATGQVWLVASQREKEQELLFIGEQFRKAIMAYYSNPVTGIQQYPEKLEDLLEDKRGPVPIRHLRKIYIDPITRTDEWGLIIEEPQQQGVSGPQANPRSAAGGLDQYRFECQSGCHDKRYCRCIQPVHARAAQERKFSK